MRVTISNYKSIRNTHIELRPGLNILVGPNGSGKTCLLSALKFLRDVFRVGAAQALARQGGARRTYHHGQTEMSFSFEHPYGDRTYRRRKVPCQFFWQIFVSQAGPEQIATITHEQLEITATYRAKKVKLFSLDVDRTTTNGNIKKFLCSPSEFGRDLFSVWDDEYRGKRKSQISEVFVGKVLPRFLDRVKEEPDRASLPVFAQFDEVIADIYWNFQFLNEYNITPDVARASTEQLPFAQMAPNGAAVSEVIDALANKRYHKLEQLRFIEMGEFYFPTPLSFRYLIRSGSVYQHRLYRRSPRVRAQYDDALDNINSELSAAVRPITSVSVEIDQTNGRRFVVFNAESEKFYPEEVSDGTVKWLCILVSLFVPFSRVYLLEEPENFLHPWMQQRLITIMRGQAKQNETIFLLSSHSATILNAANAEEILIVRQSGRGTEISELSDVDTIQEALSESDFHLGDLWVSGAIGGVPEDE